VSPSTTRSTRATEAGDGGVLRPRVARQENGGGNRQQGQQGRLSGEHGTIIAPRAPRRDPLPAPNGLDHNGGTRRCGIHAREGEAMDRDEAIVAD
jgi:hypothetical protein